ncbi:uncharacterized protein KY384_007220 [Bacidia gigantensis]|uniref:uncharacterized protein n=1 Tax=Bacidia gigantensis TaxID=2732470 RepID=UPI001D0411EE|nr:uncharacterized protein KY384_007220 [Bacidia gigantensis]KAG8528303.1 hypothetical protein KY384_007220 [Bacidia gigantensis]
MAYTNEKRSFNHLVRKMLPFSQATPLSPRDHNHLPEQSEHLFDVRIFRSSQDLLAIEFYLLQRLPSELVTIVFRYIVEALQTTRLTYTYRTLHVREVESYKETYYENRRWFGRKKRTLKTRKQHNAFNVPPLDLATEGLKIKALFGEDRPMSFRISKATAPSSHSKSKPLDVRDYILHWRYRRVEKIIFEVQAAHSTLKTKATHNLPRDMDTECFMQLEAPDYVPHHNREYWPRVGLDIYNCSVKPSMSQSSVNLEIARLGETDFTCFVDENERGNLTAYWGMSRDNWVCKGFADSLIQEGEFRFHVRVSHPKLVRLASVKIHLLMEVCFPK